MIVNGTKNNVARATDKLIPQRTNLGSTLAPVAAEIRARELATQNERCKELTG